MISVTPESRPPGSLAARLEHEIAIRGLRGFTVCVGRERNVYCVATSAAVSDADARLLLDAYAAAMPRLR